MNKMMTIAAGLATGAVLLLASLPASAGGVDIGVNIGLPGVYQPPVYVQQQPVYVQQRPVYVQERYESDWRERQFRAREWQERHRHDDNDGYRRHGNDHDRDRGHGHGD
jgi:hypothetical protein